MLGFASVCSIAETLRCSIQKCGAIPFSLLARGPLNRADAAVVSRQHS